MSASEISFAVLLNRATMVCLPQPHYGLPVIRPSEMVQQARDRSLQRSATHIALFAEWGCRGRRRQARLFARGNHNCIDLILLGLGHCDKVD